MEHEDFTKEQIAAIKDALINYEENGEPYWLLSQAEHDEYDDYIKKCREAAIINRGSNPLNPRVIGDSIKRSLEYENRMASLVNGN